MSRDGRALGTPCPQKTSEEVEGRGRDERERMSSAAWPGKRLVNQLKLDNSLPTSPQFHITRAR